MDGIPWQVVTPVATAVAGGLVWLCKKAWTLLETHAERRTIAMEAIGPSVKATFDEMRRHVTAHADEHARAVKDAESNIITVVKDARTSIVDSIELAKRQERLEAAAFRAKDPEDQTSPERPEPRTPRNPSGVQFFGRAVLQFLDLNPRRNSRSALVHGSTDPLLSNSERTPSKQHEAHGKQKARDTQREKNAVDVSVH